MSENLFYLNHVRNLLQNELDSKTAEFHTLPEGSLYTKPRKDGLHLCWSRRPSQNTSGKRLQKMLSEPYRSVAEGVQRHNFLRAQLPRLQRNLQLVEDCCKYYQPCDDLTIRSIVPSIYTAPLNYVGFDSPSSDPSPGFDSPAAFYPQGLVHKNQAGELFRSKAEVAISEILRQMDIHYNYESPLVIGSKTIYPDFQLNLPDCSRPKYLEYFGMVGHPEYSTHMINKIKLYLDHGYTPGIHILFLYESASSGFDLYAIAQVIQQFAAVPC